MPSGGGVTFRGQIEMQSKLRNVARKYPLKLKGAIVRWAEQVMTRSKSDFVPVDLGTLRASGTVTPAPGNVIGADLSFGGAASDYAAIVHETHKTKSKYLEIPLMEAAGTAAADITADAQLGDDDL